MNYNKLLALLVSALSVSLLIIFNSTNPDNLGLRGIGIVFLVIYAWFFCLIELLIRFLPLNSLRRIRQSQHFTVTALLAGVPTYLLALQSLDQLSGRDVLLVAVLSISLIFYWSKRSPN